MNSLADVLPDVSDIPADYEERAVKARLTSAGTKVGSAKRREAMLRKEKGAFQRNMGVLVGMRGQSEKEVGTEEGNEAAVNDRWAALRQNLARNMGVSGT